MGTLAAIWFVRTTETAITIEFKKKDNLWHEQKMVMDTSWQIAFENEMRSWLGYNRRFETAFVDKKEYAEAHHAYLEEQNVMRALKEQNWENVIIANYGRPRSGKDYNYSGSVSGEVYMFSFLIGADGKATAIGSAKAFIFDKEGILVWVMKKEGEGKRIYGPP